MLTKVFLQVIFMHSQQMAGYFFFIKIFRKSANFSDPCTQHSIAEASLSILIFWAFFFKKFNCFFGIFSSKRFCLGRIRCIQSFDLYLLNEKFAIVQL